jgi:hypothetical protein
MAMPCFLIVAAIAASSPAVAPKSVAPASATMARALPEPPPMSRGRRCAHRSIRRLAADPPAVPSPPSNAARSARGD